MANTITITYDASDPDDAIRVARLIAVDPTDALPCEHCDDAITVPYAVQLAFDDTFRDAITVHANHIATDSTYSIAATTNN